MRQCESPVDNKQKSRDLYLLQVVDDILQQCVHDGFNAIWILPFGFKHVVGDQVSRDLASIGFSGKQLVL